VVHLQKAATASAIQSFAAAAAAGALDLSKSVQRVSQWLHGGVENGQGAQNDLSNTVAQLQHLAFSKKNWMNLCAHRF
jgi:hypothetical protein